MRSLLATKIITILGIILTFSTGAYTIYKVFLTKNPSKEVNIGSQIPAAADNLDPIIIEDIVYQEVPSQTKPSSPTITSIPTVIPSLAVEKRGSEREDEDEDDEKEDH